jgi:tripartite-type tricarboxylate transporter receptor subunit TctC
MNRNTFPVVSRRAFIAAGAAAALAPRALAQPLAYPSRPVSIIVPFGPGNAYDQMTRYLADRLRDATDKPFIVEAKQGALGGVAAGYVARSAPDGHTLLLGANSTHAANVHLFKTLSYDPVADFAPITTLATIPQVLVVSPTVKVNTLADLIALAKSQPGKLNYGSSSATGRIASEALRQQAGIDAVHVPYRTSAQAIVDLLSGELHFLVTDAGLGVEQWRGGKVKALAITSATRVPAVADLPTVAEAGLPAFEFVAWLGLFAPARTPQPVVERLAGLVNNAVRSKGMEEYLARMYALPFPGDPNSLAQLITRDTARWGGLIKAAGIEPE